MAVERCKVLMDDKALVDGKADSAVYSMAKDHRAVVAKFGRYKRQKP